MFRVHKENASSREPSDRTNSPFDEVPSMFDSLSTLISSANVNIYLPFKFKTRLRFIAVSSSHWSSFSLIIRDQGLQIALFSFVFLTNDSFLAAFLIFFHQENRIDIGTVSSSLETSEEIKLNKRNDRTRSNKTNTMTINHWTLMRLSALLSSIINWNDVIENKQRASSNMNVQVSTSMFLLSRVL